MALAAGDRLGPYEIVAPIGVGGMGEVYKARDMRLERLVAIKVLPASDPERQQRFAREAKAIGGLKHPHICTLYDLGHQNGSDFLVMEYLEGQTLANCLRKSPLPFDRALHHAIQIASALETAHRSGIVHRDLKPGNIMLTSGGVKLLDFRLAKLLVQAGPGNSDETVTVTAPLTAEATILGTLQYMSPEQLQGKEVDGRADLWAFGCVLYEMLSNQRAFDGTMQASVIGAILHAPPEPLPDLQPPISPALARVISRCLAKDPESRWQTATDLGAELRWVAQERARRSSVDL